jgi:glucosamine--fructose-6-phosphate aminotransferase (isomerizing)
MIFKKIYNIFSTILLFATNCHIYIGRRPSAVDAPAIIIFPIDSCRLNCGFAGLMTCRLPKSQADFMADLTLATLWGKIKKAGVQTCSTGKDFTENYLGGIKTLHAMNKALSDLKREDAQEFLFFQDGRTADLTLAGREMSNFLTHEEKYIEDQAASFNSTDLETINSRLILLKDICWMLEKDILANFQKVLQLTGAASPADVSPHAFRKFHKLNLLLNAVDRLEVRGRDSAGIQLTFVLKNEKAMKDILRQISAMGLDEDYQRRIQKGDLVNSSIFIPANPNAPHTGNSVTFTYKTFSIVGELGRNVADLRNDIQNDRILRCFAGLDAACETALTHTRWASVGSITEENCHPVNNYTTAYAFSECPLYPGIEPHINVVLNGDIDNYPALRQALDTRGELIAPQLTTDTKIIPLQIEKYLKKGNNLPESFRLAVNDFEGSHAIAMTSNLEPGKMFLALKGSGQSIYIGISEDQYLFSSEIYGLVEVTPQFIKMNGETSNGSASGQMLVLNQDRGGGIRGIDACFYDGKVIHLTDDAVQLAEITTRDIDRSSYPHFFLKEISESSLSIKRTLRGKYRISVTDPSSPRVSFNLGKDMVPETVCNGLRNGDIRKIIVIGHGTAAVAGQAVADALSHYLKDTPVNIMSRVASELSGFGLKEDLTDTLIIPITQSGTTTDTNRAVAMARERGAQIISIVNRRQSDITTKSHGVFYTSDGRDIEMSVASTKAFYAQIVAGQVLGLFFAQILGSRTDNDIARALTNLESAPQLMDRIFEHRDSIAASVKATAGKKYWAIVGSGPNKAAADEIRIKLSELCYKTISSDIVENKKHIDLSAEPLILVCASGNPDSVLEDVVKDAAIFRAHKAAVIVIADEGDSRFDQVADAVIGIPAALDPLPVILNTMAGHLWGYYAALAIDKEAQIFREFRNRLSNELTLRMLSRLSILDMIADAALHRMINQFYSLFNTHRQNDAFTELSSRTIVDLLLLLKYTAGRLPLRDFYQDFKNEKGLFSPFELLDVTLGKAIDELARPIDAIRHQAKTVTVGTSRKEKELAGIVFDLMDSLDFSAKNLTHRDILTINRIQPAIAAVRGYTIYDISGLDEQGNPSTNSMIAVHARGGVAIGMKSRADHPTALMGVKRTIVSTGYVYIGKGQADGALIVILPLRSGGEFVSHLLLLHVEYNESLPISKRKEVLGYRYNDIKNLVNEYNIKWDDRYLGKITLADLFSKPVDIIAGQINQSTAAQE